MWVTGDTGEEWMWSAVGYWRYRGGMNVISCGLLAIQGRNECDQLWVTGDTGEEWMWSAVGYWRYRGGMNVISCRLLAIQGKNECDQLWVTCDILSSLCRLYPREIKLCTFRLSISLIFLNKKHQGIYSYIYNEPITDKFINSWSSKIEHMRSDVVQLVNIFNFLECEWTIHHE
jgi:hypothetical protein